MKEGIRAIHWINFHAKSHIMTREIVDKIVERIKMRKLLLKLLKHCVGSLLAGSMDGQLIYCSIKVR